MAVSARRHGSHGGRRRIWRPASATGPTTAGETTAGEATAIPAAGTSLPGCSRWAGRHGSPGSFPLLPPPVSPGRHHTVRALPRGRCTLFACLPVCLRLLLPVRLSAYCRHRHHFRPGRFHSDWLLSATAQVTDAGPAPVPDFRFGTSSSPPPASAAASATDGVPSAASGAPDGFGTAIAASSAAGYPLSGTPSRAAAPAIPASPVLLSAVASSTRARGESPASRSVVPISPSTSATDTPERAPTPTTSAGSGAHPGSGSGARSGSRPGHSGPCPRCPGARSGCAKCRSDPLCKGPWRCSSRSARSS
ncbi:hypothetical protein CU044_3577 [Streptomyces sp. L-9-10]|nr:hypothetical protein CU044_3577 [Streptomyces sp. L-9-10]